MRTKEYKLSNLVFLEEFSNVKSSDIYLICQCLTIF